MPRIRTIKPEFWTSEQVVELSLRARLLFIGMWNFADDRGVLPASAGRLKMEVFPNDDVTPTVMDLVIEELLLGGLIGVFEADNRVFWYIKGWHHQRIDRPSPRHPAPPVVGSDSTSDRRAIDEGSTTDTETEGKRKGNGNGRETEGKGKDLTIDRSIVRSKVLQIDWKKTFGLVHDVLKTIHEKWDFTDQQHISTTIWTEPPIFLDKLAKAVACVQLDVLPEDWLVSAIDRMLDTRKTSPDRWLGKVLASTAKEKYGVDFDQYQRAIKVPKKGGGE